MFLKMHEKSLWFTIHPYIWQQSCIGKNLVETEMFKCNFICSQVQWKKSSLQSLLQFTSLPFSREEAPLWQHSLGDVSITLPLPICKCFAIKQRLHSACSKRRDLGHCWPRFPSEPGLESVSWRMKTEVPTGLKWGLLYLCQLKRSQNWVVSLDTLLIRPDDKYCLFGFIF